MKRFLAAMTAVVTSSIAATLLAATPYSYRNESFEDLDWVTKATTVEAPTGTWTTNKNTAVTDVANTGNRSMLISQKAGLTLPELTEGAGMIVYYASVTNRQVNVETSVDGTNWTMVESYKTSTNGEFGKHSVEVYDPAVRWVRISSTSNNQLWIDDVLVTRLDGTDADGNAIATNLRLPYFTHNFEDKSTYPSSKEEAAAEVAYNVAGQGEWLYLNAYRSTSEAYNPAPSTANLRLLKNGSYVVTPIVGNGVAYIIFNERRTDRDLTVYTSTDGGATWKLFGEITTDTDNIIYIGEPGCNRVKIANQSGSDADIDNLTVTAFPAGTPATVGEVTVGDVTASTAAVSSTVVNPGDRDLIEQGFCWSTSPAPALADNKVGATARFTATLTDLPAQTTVYCRAYVLTFAGVAYGPEATIVTADPTAPVLAMGNVAINDAMTTDDLWGLDLEATITDNGGATITEAGFVYSTAGTPTVADATIRVVPVGSRIATIAQFAPETTLHLRAYAVNSVGTAYSDEIVYTTGSITPGEYRHEVFYCDPAGDDATADGSISRPFYSLQKAVDLVQPGDTIFMNAGTYKYGSRVNIATVGERNSGRIALFARGGRAVLDFSQMADEDNNQGIRHVGSYWHYFGLDIVGAGDNGLLIERNKPSGGSYSDIAANTHQGHDNIIENCRFIRNRDTGLQMKNLAANNLVINCDAFYNTDSTHGDADGFAVKISHGDGNYFYGCRAWQNSDDGWDQFIKKEGGFPDDITTTLENCWAFANGILENGTQSEGNGNGFKMGSNEGRNNVIMNRCLAFDNVNKGFDQNHNTGHIILNNCAGYASKDANNKSRYTYRIDEPVAANHEVRLTNCVAISDGIEDRNKSEFAPYAIVGTLVTCDMNTLPSDYLSIDTKQMTADRDEMGNLPEVDFMHIVPGNYRLIDAGTEVAPYAGQNPHAVGITFNGAAPDLGAFETGDPAGIGPMTVVDASASLNVTRTANGLTIISVEGAKATDIYTIAAYTAAGDCLMSRQFNGTSTALNLAARVPVIVNVTGADGFNATLKLLP
ncbi:MAG: right-handed parallel beta-helix repeat-containing protein [Muribaculaceae bacterium]|nr:right-handed parallel beta-helix repeat-containing protein [Muribaculaceae bacterium]